MKQLVEYLARALVDDPTPVEVYESGTPEDMVFRLKVGRDDLGKVIGKKGRTAKALRTLLAAAAAKQNARVTLEIIEPERSGAPRSHDEGASAEAEQEASSSASEASADEGGADGEADA